MLPFNGVWYSCSVLGCSVLKNCVGSDGEDFVAEQKEDSVRALLFVIRQVKNVGPR